MDTGISADRSVNPRGSLWRNLDFIKLWAGQTISELGSRITRDGLPLVAVITLGAGPFQMGLLNAIGSLPILLTGLFAGVWVDRLPRRPILIAADLGRTLVLLSIPLAAFSGLLGITQLYVVAALAGVLTVLFDVAYRAYLPFLVERGHLIEANSKLSLSGSIAELTGPGLAGVLIQALTAPVAILIDSLSFLASIASLSLIHKRETLSPAAKAARQPVLAELREGLEAVWRQPVLRSLAVTLAILSFFGNFIGALYGYYAIRVLGLGPALLGLTVAAGGASDLIGALLAGPLLRRIGLGTLLVVLLVLKSLANLLIPLAGGGLFTATAILMGAQLFGDGLMTIFVIQEISLRQSITPDRLLGRVNASMELLGAGVGPLGALIGGFLGQTIGVRPTLAVAALGGLLAALWLALSPVRRLRVIPAAEEVLGI